MDIERERQVLELLRQALGVEEGAREALVADRCGGDGALQRDVLALLRHERDAGRVSPAISSALTGDRAGGGVAHFPALDPPTLVIERLREHVPLKSRYVLGKTIGRGGMGTVFGAEDVDLGRSIAIKVMREKAGSSSGLPRAKSDALRVARFVEEAQVTGQLDHPGIPPVHELGLDQEGRLYFAMRLVRGEDFSSVIQRIHAGDVDWSATRAVDVLLRVCEAMSFAHSKGVIHRDLKPANIMVGHFGETYVMDWGLAKVMGREDSKDLRFQDDPAPGIAQVVSTLRGDQAGHGGSPLVTMDGDVIGTPCYMPPEQAAGRIEEMGPASDVYSLGAILYQTLTGAPPYLHAKPSPAPRALLERIVAESPPPIPSLKPGVPAELVAICDKAMARRPDDRYRDTLEMAADLRAYLERRVVTAYETGAFAELRKWVLRNRATSLALALALTAIIVGLGLTASVQSGARKEIALNSDFYRAHYLLDAADELWPAHPERIPDMEAWLAEANNLVSLRPVHEQRLKAIEAAEAKPAAAGTSGGVRATDRLQAGQQQELLDGIGTLAGSAKLPGLIGRIEQRLAFARGVVELTETGAAARAQWATAIASIADPAQCPAYGGLRLSPQIGLVPIGRDPDSGLWEFGHPQTGRIPVRDGNGHLVLVEDMGLVFVLIPGGTFHMGAVAAKEGLPKSLPNVDEGATAIESPVQTITLDPFFLSKYEMTQAQWQHITGSNPAFFRPGARYGGKDFTYLHPVEMVTWNDAARMMERLALELPTEAQWEYAARAGTRSMWWTGDDMSALDGVANMLDRYAQEHQGPRNWTYELWLDDGWTATAPVGRYRANPFGLHDMLGNVWEWCRDLFGDYSKYPTVRPGDGLREVDPSESLFGMHAFRGGAFFSMANTLRSAYRFPVPGFPHSDGVRPARSLDR